MKRMQLPLFLFSLLFIFKPVQAQDAYSQSIGEATTAAPMGVFGIYWNPSLLYEVIAPKGSSGWEVATGYSAFDTSNAGSPVLELDPHTESQSSSNPFLRSQQYLGSLGIEYNNMGAGMFYSSQTNETASVGALDFFQDRSSISGPSGSYDLNYQETKEQVSSLILSYSMPLPFGTFPFFSIGGSLKYQEGLWYRQDNLTGTFTEGSSSGYSYTRYVSTSGYGFGVDAGFLTQVSDALKLGMMFQNITSTLNWQAQQQAVTFDSTSGTEAVASSSEVNISTPMPYGVQLGLRATPVGSDAVAEGSVVWSQHQTRWKIGFEHYYPTNNLVVRFGTFADPISNAQLWTFGAGYDSTNFNLDFSLITRSIPNFTASIALGGGIDMGVRF